ncbi:MAG: hypothetical protein LBB61_06130 [Treponema sp.]|nr:hypothetical protein [Treponema sp.]
MKRNETGAMKAFTGRGNARDEETARLRKEIAGMRETNKILKKRWPSSREGIPDSINTLQHRLTYRPSHRWKSNQRLAAA